MPFASRNKKTKNAKGKPSAAGVSPKEDVAATRVMDAQPHKANSPEEQEKLQGAPTALFSAEEVKEAQVAHTEPVRPETADGGKANIQKPKAQKRRKKTAQQKQQEKLAGSQVAAYAPQKTTAIGNVFYMLGFYAEYYAGHIWRLLRDAGVFIAQIFSLAFGGFFKRLWGFIKSLLQDIAAPFVRFRSQKHTVRNLKTQARQNPSKEKGTSGIKIFGQGVKNYLSLLINIVKFILPVVATVALIFTVNNIFSRNYALAVQVDGEIIGYVADETVLEDAQNILRMKIQIAPNQSLAEWEFTPVLTIGTSATLSSKNEIADQILQHSSNDIMRANGIYIDGELVGVTDDGEKLNALLESIKEQYTDTEHPDATVSFVREVTVSPDGGLFFTESVQPYQDVEQLLTSEAVPAVTYMVGEDESLSDIAHANGVTLDELVMRNPEFEGRKDTYEPEVGTEVLIRRAQPYLQVQVSFRRTESEVIPFETETIEDDTLAVGANPVRVKGQDGEQMVVYDYVYVDGEQVEKVRLDDYTQVVTEPVNQVVAQGTKVIDLDPGVIPGGGAFGGYIWPVPDASYSSRGFMGAAHRGLDINAPTGTAIYASNAGIVVFSGWQWSFGYHIIIEHPDGRQTLYAHCIELYVGAGQYVGQGQLIAAVGSTGNSTGPHCHFEVIENGVRVDPYGFVASPW